MMVPFRNMSTWKTRLFHARAGRDPCKPKLYRPNRTSPYRILQWRRCPPEIPPLLSAGSYTGSVARTLSTHESVAHRAPLLSRTYYVNRQPVKGFEKTCGVRRHIPACLRQKQSSLCLRPDDHSRQRRRIDHDRWRRPPLLEEKTSPRPRPGDGRAAIF